MATGAIAAHGTLLKRSGTTIAEVKTIGGPALSMDTTDVTSHDSAAAYEEHIGTILRTGTVDLEINYIPTNATHKYAAGGLLDDFENKNVTSYSLVLPDSGSTTWTFNALVTSFTPSADHADALGASVSLKLTGQPTLA